MIHVAGFPIWLMAVLAFMFMGQMRFIARRGRMDRFGPYDRKGRDRGIDAAKLDAALGERDQVIEDLQHRLSELESRLDFTERLLAEKSHATEPR